MSRSSRWGCWLAYLGDLSDRKRFQNFLIPPRAPDQARGRAFWFPRPRHGRLPGQSGGGSGGSPAGAMISPASEVERNVRRLAFHRCHSERLYLTSLPTFTQGGPVVPMRFFLPTGTRNLCFLGQVVVTQQNVCEVIRVRREGDGWSGCRETGGACRCCDPSTAQLATGCSMFVAH